MVAEVSMIEPQNHSGNVLHHDDVVAESDCLGAALSGSDSQHDGIVHGGSNISALAGTSSEAQNHNCEAPEVEYKAVSASTGDSQINFGEMKELNCFVISTMTGDSQNQGGVTEESKRMSAKPRADELSINANAEKGTQL